MQPGDIIAERFVLDRTLGSGGMGEVWAATHVVTRKSLALKFLRKTARTSTHAHERLVREARAASAVDHPGVVPIHDVVMHEGEPVLVMELLVGESLRDRLDREDELSVDETLRQLRSVLETLEAAHAAGVVHRDLKPDNIFLTGDPPMTRLLDFGVAKLVLSDETAATLTESGAMLGTPFYMAPEQAFGEKDVDARADIWALGVVAFECLTGDRPTQADNVGQVMRLLATDSLPKLSTRESDVPAWLAAVVDRMLLLDRDKRFPSARAVLDAIDARAPTKSQRRTLPWTIGVGAVVLVGAVLVARWPASTSTRVETIVSAAPPSAVASSESPAPFDASVSALSPPPHASAPLKPPAPRASTSASAGASSSARANPLLTTPPF